ncbi:MAG: NAD(P)/FAD-dependent oxidoreductase [Thermoplasmata archaeon]
MDYEVIIIGAGYAGISSGIGVDDWTDKYLILEQRNYIGQLRTTGGIAGFWKEKISNITQNKINIGTDDIATTIKDIYIINSDGNKYELHFDFDVGYVVYPDKLEISMAKLIKDHIQLNTKVLKIRWDGSYYTVYTNQGTYTTKYIINASGLFGINVLPISKEDIIIGYEKTIKMDKSNNDNELKIFFDGYFAPNGYIWDFSGGNNIHRVGLGFPMNFHLNPKVLLEIFMKNYDYNGELIHTLSHPIPVAYPLKSVIDKNMAFVGDAGRFVFSSTGGGIHGAILSGFIAGESLKFGNFKKFEKWYNNFRPYLIRHYKIKKLLYSFSDYEFSKIFKLIQNYQPKTLNPIFELSRLVRYIALKDPTLLAKIIKNYL